MQSTVLPLKKRQHTWNNNFKDIEYQAIKKNACDIQVTKTCFLKSISRPCTQSRNLVGYHWFQEYKGEINTKGALKLCKVSLKTSDRWPFEYLHRIWIDS